VEEAQVEAVVQVEKVREVIDIGLGRDFNAVEAFWSKAA
jgi:hypothetical protein